MYGGRAGANAFAGAVDDVVAAVAVGAAIHCSARDRQCTLHSGMVPARTTREGGSFVALDNCCSWLGKPKNRFGSLILRRMEDMSLPGILLEQWGSDV